MEYKHVYIEARDLESRISFSRYLEGLGYGYGTNLVPMNIQKSDIDDYPYISLHSYAHAPKRVFKCPNIGFIGATYTMEQFKEEYDPLYIARKIIYSD